MNPRADPHDDSSQSKGVAYIKKVLNYLYAPGQVIELRSPGSTKGTISGYFDDPDKLAQAAIELSGKVPAIYLTLNPFNPDLIARSKNHLTRYAKSTTSDKDILRRVWLPMDMDAVRPSDISSSDNEHQAAIERTAEVKEWLEKDLGFPELLMADSGNGGHLLGKIDLSSTPESTMLVKRCLEALALRFSDNQVHVDLTTHNPARIFKLYGTLVCKGDDTPERPHRLAEILKVPHSINCIPLELLQKLASMAPEPQKHVPHQGNNQRFDIDEWINKSGLDICIVGAWQDGRKWIPSVCPWNADHTNRSAYILEHPSGAIAAGCHHNGCTGKNWHDLRDVVEPEWRDKGADSAHMKYAPGVQPDGAKPKQREFWPEPLDMKAFLSRPMDQTRYIWDKTLAFKSSSMLAGKPRDGKSTLCLNLALAVSRGLPFLGRETHKSSVLYLSLDNSAEDMDEMLARLGARDDDPLFIHSGTIPPNGTEWLVDVLKRNEVKLAIIDTMQRFFHLEDNHAYAEAINKMEPLDNFAKEVGFHVMYLHHAGKSGGYLGTTGYKAMCPTYMELMRVGDLQQRILTSDQRYGENFESTAIGMDKHGWIKVLGTYEDAQINEVIPKIREFVETEEGGVAESEIRKNMPARGIIVSKAIRVMIRAGTLERTGQGKKGDAFKYHVAESLPLDGHSSLSSSFLRASILGETGHESQKQGQPPVNVKEDSSPEHRDTHLPHQQGQPPVNVKEDSSPEHSGHARDTNLKQEVSGHESDQPWEEVLDDPS